MSPGHAPLTREQRASDLLRELVEALRPFAYVDGEGSDDFPDETPVVATFGRTTHYAIRLADFRRARLVFNKASDFLRTLDERPAPG